jgi:hypothetical protein
VVWLGNFAAQDQPGTWSPRPSLGPGALAIVGVTLIAQVYPTRTLTKYLFRPTLGLTMVNRTEKMAASPERALAQAFAHTRSDDDDHKFP